MKNNKFYAMSTDEILKKFQTSEEGLTSKEATKRINKYGYNELPRKKPDSILKIFLNELLDPIVLILIVATALLCLFPIIGKKNEMTRLQGSVFLLSYIVYMCITIWA